MWQPLQPSSPGVTPEGTLDTNRRPTASRQPLQPPREDRPWGDSRWESTGPGPRQPRYVSEGRYQWARTPASSHAWKSTQFLNLRYLFFFFFFNSNLLVFWLSDLCCKNSCVSWLPPSLTPAPHHHPCLFGTVSHCYLSCYVPGSALRFVWWVKRNSQHLGSAVFSVDTCKIIASYTWIPFPSLDVNLISFLLTKI